MLLWTRAKLYERLLEEKDKQLRIVMAVLDYERAMRGQPSLPAKITPDSVVPDGTAATSTDGDWVSEADEAQKIIESQGLSAVHLPEILDAMGLASSDLA